MPVPSRPRVVVVGAGFGGLWAARALSRSPADVLLIDRNNYHTFLPLLYQVAAAELEPGDIVYPVRSILRGLPNADFALAEVRRIDFSERLVYLDGRAVAYDYLIIAAGSASHFFGVAGGPEFAFPLKTLDQGIRLRNHILRCFEGAAHNPDPAERRRLLTFVIVGGGPTGVEFAGALSELLRRPLTRDYPRINFEEARVILLETAESLLPGFPDRLRAYAQDHLRRMGVEVRVRATVSQITPQATHLKDGLLMPTETVVWTAGVRGVPQAETWGLPTGRGGRVATLPTLQVAGHPEVYVVGDLAYLEEAGRPLPMVAPVAIQQGRFAAENIARQIEGREPLSFRYRDRGTMVTIGRNAAVAQLGGRSFTGFPAWLIWLSVHLFNLIGFRNRLIVLINWAWDYFLYERAVRLILPAELNPASK